MGAGVVLNATLLFDAESQDFECHSPEASVREAWFIRGKKLECSLQLPVVETAEKVEPKSDVFSSRDRRNNSSLWQQRQHVR